MRTFSKEPKRVLPALVYDTLHFSALAFGGIGAGSNIASGTRSVHCSGNPLCIAGHAGVNQYGVISLRTYTPPSYVYPKRRGVLDPYAALEYVFGGKTEPMNDRAVRRYNIRHGKPKDARIPFEVWCKLLNVVRAEDLGDFSRGANDQPTTCPRCGSRTAYDTPPAKRPEEHTCVNPECRATFRLYA